MAALAGIVCGLPAPAAAGAAGAGRAYELVSPSYTGGYGVVQLEAASEDGERVAYYSPGSFAGAGEGLSGLDPLRYLATRGHSGWSTVPIMPPAGLFPLVGASDMSLSLKDTLVLGKPGTNFEGARSVGTREEFMLHETAAPDTSESWLLAGQPLETLKREEIELSYLSSSQDFCHIFFAPNEKQKLVANTGGQSAEIYELNSGCHEEAGIRLVGLDNKGIPFDRCGEPGLGSSNDDTVQAVGGEEASSQFNAISADGSEVFIEVGVGEAVADCQSSNQLFVRLGDSKTVEVSRPIDPSLETEPCGKEEIPCKGAKSRASAHFNGASEDGSKVYFSTTAPLVSKDTGATNELYLAQIGCAAIGEECEASERRVTSLTDVAREAEAAPGVAPEVQGVVRIAPNGERVYYVARGVLVQAANSQGAMPVSGADNLYVYGAETGQTAFVAELCSGYMTSGSVEDSNCPSSYGSDTSMWESHNGEVQTAGAGGRFLVFSSNAQLTPEDTDNAKDIYRYDATTGVLSRVSLGVEGADGEGNCDDMGAANACDATIPTGPLPGSLMAQHELGTRAISEDGSRIVFSTAAPLSPAAGNGLANAYEWHESPGTDTGAVSLISSGTGETPVADLTIAPDGRDVFFISTVQLTSQYVDGLPAIYDARLGGGFPAPPASSAECESEGCYGPLTNPAPLLVPGSATQAPGQSHVAPAKSQQAKSSKAGSTKRRRRKARRHGGGHGRPKARRARAGHPSKEQTPRGGKR